MAIDAELQALEEARDILDEVVQFIRGNEGNGYWLNQLGSEPDDYAFAQIVLPQGLTKRIFEATGQLPSQGGEQHG